MRGVPKVFDNFAGGIDTDEYQSSGFLTGFEDNQPRVSLDFVSSAKGTLVRRDGSPLVATVFTSDPLVGIATADTSATSANNSVIVQAASGKIHVVTLSSGTKTLLTTLGPTPPFEWVTAPVSGGQGPAYGSDGTNVKYVSGTTMGGWTASTGTLHPCKYLAYAGNRVWMTGDPSNPSRVYFSNLADPRDWPAANVFDLAPEDGQPITGIAVIGPYVVISKAQKMWAVYDLDTGANRQISDSIGAIAHRTMQETPEGLFFLTPSNGIYKTDGSTVRPVTKWWGRDRSLGIDATAAAGFFKNRYILSTADGIVEWNLDLGTLWAHSLQVRQFAPYGSAASPKQKLYGAGFISGNGAILDTFAETSTVDGAGAAGAITYVAHWRGPWWEFGQPRLRKRCRGIVFDGFGTLDTVGVAKDNSGSFTTVGSALTMQVGSATPPARLPGLGVARSWSLDITASSTFELRSIIMAMVTRAD